MAALTEAMSALIAALMEASFTMAAAAAALTVLIAADNALSTATRARASIETAFEAALATLKAFDATLLTVLIAEVLDAVSTDSALLITSTAASTSVRVLAVMVTSMVSPIAMARAVVPSWCRWMVSTSPVILVTRTISGVPVPLTVQL